MRWLSTERAIEGVYDDYEALTQTLANLKCEGDSAAIGLLMQINNIKFIGAVYHLHEALPILSNLSKAFQKGAVSFAAIAPAIRFTTDELEEIEKQETPCKRLKEDLAEGGRLSQCGLPPFTQSDEVQLERLTYKYIYALKENIPNRFGDSLPVLTAFKIFDPLAVPSRSSPGFRDYALSDVKILADHFYEGLGAEEKKDAQDNLGEERERDITPKFLQIGSCLQILSTCRNISSCRLTLTAVIYAFPGNVKGIS